jgi:hypothetical protein
MAGAAASVAAALQALTVGNSDGSAAVQAVFGQDALLHRILACDDSLEGADLARAAVVSRTWRRVASTDDLWRRACLAAAPALSATVDMYSAPRGFRARVAQLHAALRVARAAPATARPLDDFFFAVDIAWRGRPFFSGLFPAANLEDGNKGDAWYLDYVAICAANALTSAAADTQRPLRARPTLEELERQDPVFSLRVMVMRTDGAMAVLAELPDILIARTGVDFLTEGPLSRRARYTKTQWQDATRAARERCAGETLHLDWTLTLDTVVVLLQQPCRDAGRNIEYTRHAGKTYAVLQFNAAGAAGPQGYEEPALASLEDVQQGLHRVLNNAALPWVLA